MNDDSNRDTPMHVSVYTDGGCNPNPGPGGWGAVVRFADHEWVLSGNDPQTTNNRMELQAACAALALLEGVQGTCQVALYTDSEYLRRGITEWIAGWMRNGWRTVEGQPVRNQDLWSSLHRLTQVHQVEWHWIKGHAGHPANERADRLATEARRALEGPVSRPPAPEQGGREQQAGEGRPDVTICVKGISRSTGSRPIEGGRGPAGWGAVLRAGERTKSLHGSEPSATANAMLVRGAAEALRALNAPSRVTVVSDADYLIKGAALWVRGWKANGWRTREGKPVANRAEWEALLVASNTHDVRWVAAPGDGTTDRDLVLAADLARSAVEEATEVKGGAGTEAEANRTEG